MKKKEIIQSKKKVERNNCFTLDLKFYIKKLINEISRFHEKCEKILNVKRQNAKYRPDTDDLPL